MVAADLRTFVPANSTRASSGQGAAGEASGGGEVASNGRQPTMGGGSKETHSYLFYFLFFNGVTSGFHVHNSSSFTCAANLAFINGLTGQICCQNTFRQI
jgi:hypothetical protein